MGGTGAQDGSKGLEGPDALRQMARTSAWYATVLQAEGRTPMRSAGRDRAIAEAEAADDPDALGAACFVMGVGVRGAAARTDGSR